MAVLADRQTSGCANHILIITQDWFGVCDGDHSAFVMKPGYQKPVAGLRLVDLSYC